MMELRVLEYWCIVLAEWEVRVLCGGHLMWYDNTGVNAEVA